MKMLVNKLEKNKYIRFVSVVAVVLGALITIVSFFGDINNYLDSNIFISKNISEKVNDLSAGQSINYFKQSLGAEKIQNNISEKYSEYIFQYKKVFIQALVNKANNEVIYWAITYCGRNPVIIERQIFSMSAQYTGKKDFLENETFDHSFGNKLFLNKSSFTDIFKNIKGDFRYFISGATANSFAYESVYLGNPSAYQTIIIGVNDICPTSYDDLSIFGFDNNTTQERIEKFRNNSRVNTYGETSPFYGDDVLKLLDAQQFDEPYITFGVDRIKVRYFNE